ncbi:nucleoside triphosphate pyrophosphatase [Saccharibacter sp. 17.LH.SD]|uniref:Maf family protein n=1 Tax=Saccharibacter sp. 17.LH.SD TaxID=2689393 RepID=UPI0019280956|nr:nucleoside triphosphate pyrophosphatase [Saccharibacter sp. 17.LH.SD]
MMNYFPTRFPLILASSSTIRQRLLTEAGVKAIAIPAHIDEDALRNNAQNNSIAEMTYALANAKADAISKQSSENDIIIAADQILECNGTIFAKPSSIEDARRHLQYLRGRTHTLYTALVLWKNKKCVWQHLSTPQLTMRNFSDAFLEQYLRYDSHEIIHCVGAYRMEGPGIHLFKHIEGEMDAVLGLPRLPLLEALRCHAGLMT